MIQTVTPTVTPKSVLYDADFLLWTEETVAKLKARDFEGLDLVNLIEEIESLGRSEKREIKSRLIVLLEHLLKRIYVNMPDCYGGWENTIGSQRTNIQLLITDSPSLKSFWDESFTIAFELALKNVCKSYKSCEFPDTWQFSRELEAILNIDFWEYKDK